MGKHSTSLLALVLLAFATSARASSAELTLLLTVDPLRVLDSEALKFRADIGGKGSLRARRSVLKVKNSSGKIVFTKKDAFLSGLLAEPAHEYSLRSNSERSPGSLPPGAYTAIWTMDDLKSNTAHFTVGTGSPRALTLEQLENGHGACLLLHVVNTSSKPVAFCDMVFGVNIIIDGRTYKGASGCGVGGHPGLMPKEGFSMPLSANYQLINMKGRHKISAEYREHRSNEINARCE